MRRFRKNVLSVLIGAFVVIGAVIAYNSTDVSLSPEVLTAVQPVSATAGFPLQKLKVPLQESEVASHFSSYEEYNSNSEKYDAALAKNAAAMAPLLEAVRQRQVAVEAKMSIEKGVFVYPLQAHRYFLVLLSQKIKAGKTAEALSLLEDSNYFLTSILNSPQLLINTMITAACLDFNAKFAKSLEVAGVLKSLPPSLKQSFHVANSSQQIFESSEKREVQVGAEYILNAAKGPLSFSSLRPNPDSVSLKLIDIAFKTLYRPQQTANWYAKMSQELQDPPCKSPAPADCSATYRTVVEDRGLSYYVINPFGRGVVATLIPKLAGVQQKLDQRLANIQQTASSL